MLFYIYLSRWLPWHIWVISWSCLRLSFFTSCMGSVILLTAFALRKMKWGDNLSIMNPVNARWMLIRKWNKMDFLNSRFSTERKTLIYDIWYMKKMSFELHLEDRGEVWKKTLGWKRGSAALLMQAWPWGDRAFSSNQGKEENLWGQRLLRLKMTKLKGLRSGAWHTCPHPKLSCRISGRSSCFCGKLRGSQWQGVTFFIQDDEFTGEEDCSLFHAPPVTNELWSWHPPS